MRQFRILLATTALGLMVATAPAWAQSTPPAQTGGGSIVDQVTDIVFSEVEKRVLREVLGNGRYETTEDGGYARTGKDGRYDDLERRDAKHYVDDDAAERRRERAEKQWKEHGKKGKGRGKGLPPGLAKRDRLPPGLQKQLEKNGRLPPGLRANPLPYEAVVNLPPPAAGTERAIVDNDVVLIERGTGLVLDILKDVLTKKN